MMLQPITYRGHTVPAATPRRFFLADELHNQGPSDPETTFVCLIFCYAAQSTHRPTTRPYTD